MGDHKRIIVEDFPAHKLPDELRRDIAPNETVRVTVEQVETPQRTRRDLMTFFGTGKGVYTEEEAVSFIRKLRDE